MTKFLLAMALLAPGHCLADTFVLMDGARLEGEVTGEMDGMLLVKTRYGSLTIAKDEVRERIAAQPPAQAQAAEAAVSTAAAAAVSTATAAVELSTAQPVAEAAPRLTFQTVFPSTSARLVIYSENGVAVATETVPAAGEAALEGAIPDGTYTEYYPEGGLKTVKTMLGGKANGSLKAYYPSGALQAEAYYLAGGKDGTLKYFTEQGALMLQAEYRNDRLNGWRREYAADGSVAAEAYYADDHPAVPPQAAPAAGAAPAQAPESQYTAKAVRLARGERYSFQFNGKYIGKLMLDKDFNVISVEGRLPAEPVKFYGRDGALEKEFLFEGRELKGLRAYGDGGQFRAEYRYDKDKAVKK